MSSIEVKSEIKEFMKNNFMNYSLEVSDETSLLENGIIDSTSILELISFVEEKFNLEVSDEEIIPENFDSVENLTLFVKKKLGENHG
ncbi:MAG: acyl carrier protein [Calditrichia bacterium]